jgi:hypothetical protein
VWFPLSGWRHPFSHYALTTRQCLYALVVERYGCGLDSDICHIHLQCTFSLSPVHMKVRDSDVLAWFRGQRKMSQILGVFGLLDSTFLWPLSFGTCFETYESFISLIFQFFFSAVVNCGYVKLQIRGHNCIFKISLLTRYRYETFFPECLGLRFPGQQCLNCKRTYLTII